jgi:hypothetical protein
MAPRRGSDCRPVGTGRKEIRQGGTVFRARLTPQREAEEVKVGPEIDWRMGKFATQCESFPLGLT